MVTRIGVRHRSSYRLSLRFLHLIYYLRPPSSVSFLSSSFFLLIPMHTESSHSFHEGRGRTPLHKRFSVSVLRVSSFHLPSCSSLLSFFLTLPSSIYRHETPHNDSNDRHRSYTRVLATRSTRISDFESDWISLTIWQSVHVSRYLRMVWLMALGPTLGVYQEKYKTFLLYVSSHPLDPPACYAASSGRVVWHSMLRRPVIFQARLTT